MSPNTMRPTTPPATQKTRLCHQISRLPRTVPRRHRDHKRHPCHTRLPHKSTKGTPLSPTHLRKKSNVDVTNAKRQACHTKSRRARGPSAPLDPEQRQKCHACRTEVASMPPSATLPHKGDVDVARGRACHKKVTSMSLNFRPAAQSTTAPRRP